MRLVFAGAAALVVACGASSSKPSAPTSPPAVTAAGPPAPASFPRVDPTLAAPGRVLLHAVGPTHALVHATPWKAREPWPHDEPYFAVVDLSTGCLTETWADSEFATLRSVRTGSTSAIAGN